MEHKRWELGSLTIYTPALSDSILNFSFYQNFIDFFCILVGAQSSIPFQLLWIILIGVLAYSSLYIDNLLLIETKFTT